MSSLLSLIYRSHLLKVSVFVLFCTLTALIDHAMHRTLDWSFLLTWQLFIIIFMYKPTTPSFLPTALCMIYDVLGGITIGHTAFLIIFLQIIILFSHNFLQSLPFLPKSILLATLLLITSIPDWLLISLMFQEFLPFTPAFVTKLPMALSFPVVYFVISHTARFLAFYEHTKS